MITAWPIGKSQYPSAVGNKPTCGDVDYCSAYGVRGGEQMESLGRSQGDPSEGTGWVRRTLRMGERLYHWGLSGSGGAGTGYDKRLQILRGNYGIAPE